MAFDFTRDLRANLPEDVALRCHFIYNHFPRVSLAFLPVAREALQLARDGDFTTKLELPNGERLSIAKVVDDLHLQAFIDDAEGNGGN